MVKLSELSLQRLIAPEGFECTCGKRHTCPLGFIDIGRNNLDKAPDMVRALGAKRPFVLMDAITQEIAGERVCGHLKDAGIEFVPYVIPGEKLSPAEWEVGSALMAFDPACDLILGVGSGVINDICKVQARALRLPSAIIGTAPSMDGYASASSAMEVNHVKSTLNNHAPAGILLDTEVLCQAPEKMLWAGLGDMLAKYVAMCEWKIATAVVGDYYCENVAQLMRTALERIVKAAPGIANRDPDAIRSIAEGLVLSGIAMSYAGISRPASGFEHYFSHMWEMMALAKGEPYELHGIQVGIGTVLALKIFKKLRYETPDKKKSESASASFNESAWHDEIVRVFRGTSGEIFSLEEKLHKNTSEARKIRFEKIQSNWDVITKAMDDELPDLDSIITLMRNLGMPTKPSDIGLSVQDAADAFRYGRDSRDKYLTSGLIWDMGLMDEYTAYLTEVAEL